MEFCPGEQILPILPNPDAARSPIVGLAWDEMRPRQIGYHSHRRGQIISVIKGVATVGTRDGIWVLPSDRAIWMPAGTEHWVRYSKTTSRSLFIAPEASIDLPSRLSVLHLDGLSRELLNTAVTFEWDLDPKHPEMRLAHLLLGRMPQVPQNPVRLPDGKDQRVLRVMHALRQEPDNNQTLAQWGAQVGASERTLARLFVGDTEMSFAEWRRQMRLMFALEQLASGVPVTLVAHNLGYNTAGNFSTMFRNAMQHSPRDYFRVG